MSKVRDILEWVGHNYIIACSDKARKFIKDKAEQKLKELLPEKILHSHDSIPCYTGEENEGCIVCVKNQAIANIVKNMFGKEE